MHIFIFCCISFRFQLDHFFCDWRATFDSDLTSLKCQARSEHTTTVNHHLHHRLTGLQLQGSSSASKLLFFSNLAHCMLIKLAANRANRESFRASAYSARRERRSALNSQKAVYLFKFWPEEAIFPLARDQSRPHCYTLTIVDVRPSVDRQLSLAATTTTLPVTGHSVLSH